MGRVLDSRADGPGSNAGSALYGVLTMFCGLECP